MKESFLFGFPGVVEQVPHVVGSLSGRVQVDQIVVIGCAHAFVADEHILVGDHHRFLVALHLHHHVAVAFHSLGVDDVETALVRLFEAGSAEQLISQFSVAFSIDLALTV